MRFFWALSMSLQVNEKEKINTAKEFNNYFH